MLDPSFPSQLLLGLFLPATFLAIQNNLSSPSSHKSNSPTHLPLLLMVLAAHQPPILLSASLMVRHQPTALDMGHSDGRSVHPSSPASLRALSLVPTTWLSCTARIKDRQAANSVCRSTTPCCESRLCSLVHAGFPTSSLASQPKSLLCHLGSCNAPTPHLPLMMPARSPRLCCPFSSFALQLHFCFPILAVQFYLCISESIFPFGLQLSFPFSSLHPTSILPQYSGDHSALPQDYNSTAICSPFLLVAS